MKKIIVSVCCLIICLCLSSCANKDTSSSNHKKQEELLIAESLKEEKSQINDSEIKYYKTSSENNEDTPLIKDISVPSDYNKVIKNNKGYIYDSKGNQIIISVENPLKDFSKITKNDYSKIIVSNYQDIKLKTLEKCFMLEKNGFCIKFESKKNDIILENICYYLDYGEKVTKIFLQAKTEDDLNSLIKYTNSLKIS